MTLKALAKALDVTVDELIGSDFSAPQIYVIAHDEVALLKDYRSLNDQGKEYVRQSVFVALGTYKKLASVPSVEAKEKLG